MRRKQTGPWWQDFVLLAAVIAVCGIPLLLWPSRPDGAERLATGGVLAACLLVWVLWMRRRNQGVVHPRAPWTRAIDARPRVRGAFNAVRAASDAFRLLSILAWTLWLLGAGAVGFFGWLQRKPVEPAELAFGGIATILLVVVVAGLIYAPFARAGESRRMRREAAERATERGDFAPVIVGGPITATPPNLETRAQRREARAAQMLAAMGAEPAQIEQARASRRAKLLDREQHRAQRAAATERVAEDRNQANRALGRD